MCVSVRETKEIATGPIALTITMGRSLRPLVLRREGEKQEVGLARPDPLLRHTKHGLHRPRTKPKCFNPRDKRKVVRKEGPENGPLPPLPIEKAVVRLGLATRERVTLARPGRLHLGVPMGTKREEKVANRAKASPRAFGF